MLTLTPITDIIQHQRHYFATGKTKDIAFRLEQLKRLKSVIESNETAIIEALRTDLSKPTLESYLAEFHATLKEIEYTIKHLKRWMKPRNAGISLIQFPAVAKIYPEPLGVVLIIAPWNYPFSLMIQPLIGAIAAGNCAILKPSEITPATSSLLAQLIETAFDPDYITVIEGDAQIAQQLLAEKFDHIFFTGGTAIAQKVMTAAAQHLTPVTLELGGKTPCIVDIEVDLDETAKRIVWGKFLNAGQTCIAPDYLLVHRSLIPPLIDALKHHIKEFYGENPPNSPDYARIVSDRHFQRLQDLLQDGKIVFGGQTDATTRYIAPTLVTSVDLDAPLMQEEIFGPILPILEYNTLEEAIAFVNERPKPLALYLFSQNKAKQQQILNSTSSGGVCLNDTIMHVGIPDLPFGGVGASGMGNYHGKASFDTFSHYKSVLKRFFWLEFNLRYPPYGDKLKLFKRLLGR